MAKIEKEPKYACSASVQKMRDELGDALVTANDITGYLLGMHPEYAQGLGEHMILAREAGAVKRSVDDWLSAVSRLYEVEDRPLDGRLVILGLALMIRQLQSSLRQNDFLMILMVEYEPRYKSLLSPAGIDLYYELRGRPRMDESGGQAKGLDGPGSPFESLGDEQANVDDIFESFDLLSPPMAAMDEPEEVASAVGSAEEEVFETVSGRETAETPHNGGAKGIAPESLQETIGAEEEPLRQARRLEAAMPESVRVDETTELLVMLPRAQSEGLRAELPKETVGGEIIDKDDVEARDAELVFAASDTPLIVYFAVEASQKDFEIEEPVKRVKIYAGRDGDYETFYLTPLRPTKRAPVQVRLYRDEELTDAVSTIRLFTKIEPPDAGGDSDPQFAGIRRALAYASGPVNITIAGDVISVGDISNASGVAIGREAEAEVGRTATVFAVEITQLFTPLLNVVSSQVPQDQISLVIGHVQALQVEIERGPDANDPQIATHLQHILEVVPESGKTLLELFVHPEVKAAAGDVTRLILGNIEQA